MFRIFEKKFELFILFLTALNLTLVSGQEKSLCQKDSTSIAIKLKEMHANDQKYRMSMAGPDELQWKIDDQNVVDLKEMIEKYSYPCLIHINNMAVTTILMHTSPEERNYFLPLAYKAAKEKLQDPFEYAILIDNMEYGQTGKQIFGTCTCGGNTYLCPIKDIKVANEKRADLNMESLEDFMKRRELKFYPESK